MENEVKILGSVRLLLVDDEDMIIETTRRLLEKRGYSVSAAAGGEEALSLMQEKEFEVALIDLKMPRMDGIELMKEIWKKDERIEVILLTGHGSKESAIEGMRAGASDYITKPADISEIISRINMAMEKREAKKR